jgi:hypothetical protein
MGTHWCSQERLRAQKPVRGWTDFAQKRVRLVLPGADAETGTPETEVRLTQKPVRCTQSCPVATWVTLWKSEIIHAEVGTRRAQKLVRVAKKRVRVPKNWVRMAQKVVREQPETPTGRGDPADPCSGVGGSAMSIKLS